jgi:hypothetical protein
MLGVSAPNYYATGDGSNYTAGQRDSQCRSESQLGTFCAPHYELLGFTKRESNIKSSLSTVQCLNKLWMGDPQGVVAVHNSTKTYPGATYDHDNAYPHSAPDAQAAYESQETLREHFETWKPLETMCMLGYEVRPNSSVASREMYWRKAANWFESETGVRAPHADHGEAVYECMGDGRLYHDRRCY